MRIVIPIVERRTLLIGAAGVFAILLIAWVAWRLVFGINSYDECVRHGNIVLTSYPKICVTNDGRYFADPREHVTSSPH